MVDKTEQIINEIRKDIELFQKWKLYPIGVTRNTNDLTITINFTRNEKGITLLMLC